MNLLQDERVILCIKVGQQRKASIKHELGKVYNFELGKVSNFEVGKYQQSSPAFFDKPRPLLESFDSCNILRAEQKFETRKVNVVFVSFMCVLRQGVRNPGLVCWRRLP